MSSIAHGQEDFTLALNEFCLLLEKCHISMEWRSLLHANRVSPERLEQLRKGEALPTRGEMQGLVQTLDYLISKKSMQGVKAFMSFDDSVNDMIASAGFSPDDIRQSVRSGRAA